MKRKAVATHDAPAPGYLRRNGWPLALLGIGVGLFFTPYFWMGISLSILGGVLLAVDVWKEVVVPAHTRGSKIIFTAACLTVLSSFSFWLFRPVPLILRAVSTVPEYSIGSNIDGIYWEEEYSEMRLTIRNPSETDYENFDVEISTDLTIEGLQKTDGLASCTIAPVGETFQATRQTMAGGKPVGPAVMDDPNYKAIAIDKNGSPVAFSGGTSPSYRIRCDRFPANSRSSFVAALSVRNPFVKNKYPEKLYAAPRAAMWCTAKAKFSTLGRPRSAEILECKIGQDCKS